MIRTFIVLSWLAASAAAADPTLYCTSVPDAVFDAEHGGCVKRSKSVDPTLAAYFAGLDALGKDPKQAFVLFERGCKGNYGPACTKLANLYETGRGRAVTKDPAKARALFEQACKLGDGAGCQRTGSFIMSAQPEQARKWFERGCKANNGTACALLAFMIEQGMGGDANPKVAAAQYAKAWKLLDKNCPKDGTACLAAGMMYQKGLGRPLDLDRTLSSFVQSCDAGVNDGCVQAAIVMDKKSKPAEALVLWKRGCQYEHAAACSVAARRMVIADHGSAAALELAKSACELDTKECEILAQMYDAGHGGMAKPDRSYATQLYKTLCDAGDNSGCTRYASRARRGVGMTANPDAADQLLEQTCARDDADACAQLAGAYTANKKDDAKGFAAAQKACTLGNAHGCYVAGWMIRRNRRGAAKLEDAPAAKEALPYFEKSCTAETLSPAGCNEAAKLYDKGIGTNEDKTAAAERYKKACGSGDDVDSAACLSLATMTFDGTGSIKKDPAEALRLYVRACVNGESDGCDWLPAHVKTADERKLVMVGLGPVCATGEHDDVCLQLAFTLVGGAGSEKRDGFEIFGKMCGRKNPRGCLYQAEGTYNGWGTLQDKAKGEALYKQLCEEPSPGETDHPAEATACLDLVRAYMEQKKDNQYVLQYAELACKLGNGDGCNTVAFLHYTAAKGITWSATVAAEYYKKGCDKGSALACSNNAELYRYGIAVKKDPAKAAKIYKDVCDGGGQYGVYGCAGYAHYVASGEGGVKKDPKAAEKMMREACKVEVSEACIELAELLASTRGANVGEIAELRGQGVTITERNADADNPEYMWRMGVFYRDGIAKPKDPVKAREWFAKACEKYDPLGCLDAGKAFSTIDRDKARVYFTNACGSQILEACEGAKALEMPSAAAPGKVHAKGCGGCSASGDGGLLVLLGFILLRRPRSRAAASRDRSPASRA